jgi:hypothetical protein
MPAEWRERITAGNLTFAVVATDVMPHATCLHHQGYLSAAGLEAVRRYAEEVKPRWEKLLFGLGLVTVVAVAGLLLFDASRSESNAQRRRSSRSSHRVR